MPSGDKQALVCFIEDFSPSGVSVKWKMNTDSVTEDGYFVSQNSGDVRSAVSILKVDKSNWDSETVYTCEVTHQGRQYIQKVSKGTEPL